MTLASSKPISHLIGDGKMSAQPTIEVTKITNQKDGKPGHLYCAVVERESFSDEAIYDRPTYDSFEGLYWLGGDGELYAVANAVDEKDDLEPSYPDYDYLVEQVGSFSAEYAK